MKTEDTLAKLLHDAWRKKKRRENKWHTPMECADRGCPRCHKCVDEWENLTDKEKELALLNSKVAHAYFKKQVLPAGMDKQILEIMDDNLRAGTAVENLEGIICNRFATASKIVGYVKKLMDNKI